MKQIIRIIYCNSIKSIRFGKHEGYKRTASEFLMGTNYCNRFIDLITTSNVDYVISRTYVGNKAVGYDIYLEYSKEVNGFN